MERAPAGDRRRPHPHDLTDDRAVHEQPRHEHHVAGARVVTGRVEPVGPREVRVAEAELVGARVHHRDEARLASVADVVRQRVRSVVGALDQRGLDELADGQALTG